VPFQVGLSVAIPRFFFKPQSLFFKKNCGISSAIHEWKYHSLTHKPPKGESGIFILTFVQSYGFFPTHCKVKPTVQTKISTLPQKLQVVFLSETLHLVCPKPMPDEAKN